MVYTFAITLMAAQPYDTTATSNIARDETVQFFPTYARRTSDGAAWEATIHAWVFEPEENSTKRAALLGLLRRVLGMEREQIETALFKERARFFLVDNEGGKTVVVRLDDRQHELPPTASNGHSKARVRIAGTALEAPTWRALDVVLEDSDSRVFSGRCVFIPPVGLSVISDIDDTVKITGVNSEQSVMRNTFLREFEAVDGMAALYGRWADVGASFHYVSASPWQLCHELDSFFAHSRLPRGTMHLRPLRFKDGTFFEFLGSSREAKLEAISTLMDDFPQRRFILVGDSTDRDPEVYGEIARAHIGQIQRILIRVVDPTHNDKQRFDAAFDELPSELWQVFTHPREVQE